jgi:hypothetical protein
VLRDHTATLDFVASSFFTAAVTPAVVAQSANVRANGAAAARLRPIVADEQGLTYISLTLVVPAVIF